MSKIFKRISKLGEISSKVSPGADSWSLAQFSRRKLERSPAKMTSLTKNNSSNSPALIHIPLKRVILL